MNDNPLDAPRRAPEDARPIPRACDCTEPDPVMQTDGKFYCYTCSFQTGARPKLLAEVEVVTLQQAVTQGAREQRRLEKALNESQARVADLSARLVQVEQERDAHADQCADAERAANEQEHRAIAAEARAERLAQALTQAAESVGDVDRDDSYCGYCGKKRYRSEPNCSRWTRRT